MVRLAVLGEPLAEVIIVTNPAVMAFWHLGGNSGGGHGDHVKRYTITGVGQSWGYRWVVSGRWPR